MLNFDDNLFSIRLEGKQIDTNNPNDIIPDELRKTIEKSDKLRKSVAPILEQQEKMNYFVKAAMGPQIKISTPALDVVKEITENSAVKAVQDSLNTTNSITSNTKAMQLCAGAGSAIEALQKSNTLKTIGELAIKSAMPTYQFESPALKAFDNWSKNAVTNLVSGLNSLVKSTVIQEIHSITSSLGTWLQTVDFSPLTSILENIRTIGFEFDYKEINEIFLKAMFDAKWFPYAGWIADFRIVDEMLEILDTSRASKNRIKRIDRLIFSYYNKDEINNLKRGWRQMNLPSYMTRILVQSVQAYHRREYALTVSALSTLWEGIIQGKAKDESYRVSKKTRENLTKLIEENEFDRIFSSFCEEFIFYDCKKAEEVKPDVPGRHGIAHCWYNTYPNRKVALNAILFTDFLLGLKPLDKTEEKENG
ncbi:Uncharacterised protein [uncultured Roseburia sp.]|uniref:Uncharacterized protein n=1 Tax=Brotonthovivens ammoniilytica TaxID=2981725 RepID=A0ABT2TIJ9_9FIRM|nr:hypothetical protein [Brotonthovivens ammoniilytica]MCU6762028.1 hypothetical protein [Brotonthovivens ammoniilytica]SCI53362.1 Uncharacterised protein [uncultured Roseburia sp.]